jgi:hypothetical protein
MDLREIDCGDGEWMELAQDRIQCPEISIDARDGGTAELPVILPVN